MQTYLMTVHVKMNCFDDLDARGKALEVLELSKIRDLSWEGNCSYISETEVKLQEIKDNAPPRKVKI